MMVKAAVGAPAGASADEEAKLPALVLRRQGRVRATCTAVTG